MCVCVYMCFCVIIMFCNFLFEVFMIPNTAPSIDLDLLDYVSYIINASGLNGNAPIITNQLLSRGIGKCVLVSVLMPDEVTAFMIFNLNNALYLKFCVIGCLLSYLLVLNIWPFCLSNKQNNTSLGHFTGC